MAQSAAVAAAAAAPPAAASAAAIIPTSSNGQVLDAHGLQHLQVQSHAAAVQLLNRSLAVAHLRAELAKPRWGTWIQVVGSGWGCGGSVHTLVGASKCHVMPSCLHEGVSLTPGC